MNATALERLTDRKAEQAVNGSILIDPDVLLKLAGTLAPEDFYYERDRHVYGAALALYEQQQPIDYLTMCGQLEHTGHLNEIGGAAYLTELIEHTPTAMNADSYADTLLRLSLRRRLAQMSIEVAKIAYGANGHSNAQVLDQVRGLVDSVTPATSDADVLLWLDSLERFVLAQVQRNNEGADRDAGKARLALRLPWSAFEPFKVRLRRGTLAIIVAGSSVGKTSFMECCAEYWARLGYQVAFFHLELQHQTMLDRRMARLTGIPIEQLEDGLLDERTEQATRKMRAYKGGINYVHCPGWSARAISAKARQLHAKGLCDVFIGDYLQKERLWIRKGGTENNGLADAVEVHKNCCEQLGIAGVLGSQVNRKAREAFRITEEHVRGSGEIGEKANIVITLHREIMPVTGERSPLIEARVDKNTMGKTGDTKLAIRGERFQITDVSLKEEQ